MDEKELKEIEEMQNDIVKSVSYDEWSSREYGQPVIDFYETAENMHKLCYRKTPEGAVVLTKAEHDKFRQHWHKEYRDGVDFGRKETAKEILGKLLSVVQDKRNKLAITTRDPSIGGQCKAYADMETTLREIALDISVEVEA